MQNIKKFVFFAVILIAGLYLPINADNVTENTPIAEDTISVAQDSAPTVQEDASEVEKVPSTEDERAVTAKEFVVVAALRIKEAILEKSAIEEELSHDLIDAHEYLVKIMDQNNIIEAHKRQLHALCGNFDKKQQYARALAVQLEKIKEEFSRKTTGLEVFKALDREIYQQKVIAGDMMSPQKKLLIGAMTGAALGCAAVYSGLLTAAAAGLVPVVAQEVVAQQETHPNEPLTDGSEVVAQQTDDQNLPMVSKDDGLRRAINWMENQESNVNDTVNKVIFASVCAGSIVLFSGAHVLETLLRSIN